MEQAAMPARQTGPTKKHEAQNVAVHLPNWDFDYRLNCLSSVEQTSEIIHTITFDSTEKGNIFYHK